MKPIIISYKGTNQKMKQIELENMCGKIYHFYGKEELISVKIDSLYFINSKIQYLNMNKVEFIYDDLYLVEELTVKENIYLYSNNVKIKEDLNRCMKFFNLDKKMLGKNIKKLDHNDMEKFILIRLLLMDADIVMLDCDTTFSEMNYNKFKLLLGDKVVILKHNKYKVDMIGEL